MSSLSLNFDSSELVANFVIANQLDATFQISGVTVYGGGNFIPIVHFNVIADGNNQTFTNTQLSLFNNATTYSTLFKNGVALEPETYSITGNSVVVNTELDIGDTICIMSSGVTDNPNVSLSNIAPTTSNSPGYIGDIVYDNNYIYVCIATNTWRRSQLGIF